MRLYKINIDFSKEATDIINKGTKKKETYKIQMIENDRLLLENYNK